MQAVLDAYLDGYNHRRPHQGRGMAGPTPAQAFIEGLPPSSARGGARQDTHPQESRLTPAPQRHCQVITFSVQLDYTNETALFRITNRSSARICYPSINDQRISGNFYRSEVHIIIHF
jgi:hypothetical protein